MRVFEKEVKDLIPYEFNNKIHDSQQINRIANSIKEFWFTQPIVIDKNNVVIIGHGRLEASKKLNLSKVPVVMMDELTENQIKKLRILDNKLNESQRDEGNLRVELEELGNLDIGDLKLWVKDLFWDIITEDEIEIEEDEIPEIKKETIIKRGDIFQLWEHKVMCGDSTSERDVESLLGGAIIRCVFSSPPYNMGGGKIAGKDLYTSYSDDYGSEEYIDFNIRVVSLLIPHLKGFLFWNISYNKNSRVEFLRIANKLADMMYFREMIVWNKKKALPTLWNDLLNRIYEDIFVYEVDNGNKCEILNLYGSERGLLYNKDRKKILKNYREITVDNNTQQDNHKACYPVKLPCEWIKFTTEVGDIVYDPFGWSGTNIIACEQLGRVGYCMEYDPEYVDIIIRRFNKLNPDKPIKCINRDIDINKILSDN